MVLVVAAIVAFYVACNLGANDVANAMGTSVGSKAITLRQAIAIAAVLELSGALLFGDRVSSTLVNHIVTPTDFSASPHTLVMGMIAALLACGLWVQGATWIGLPVSSSHAIVGAIAGFGVVALGVGAIAWNTLGLISVTWVMTPLISGAIAALFYATLHRWVLTQADAIHQLYDWIPWLSTVLVCVFGAIVFPVLFTPDRLAMLPMPPQAVRLGVGAIAIGGMTGANWRALSQRVRAVSERPQPMSPTLIRQVLESLLARFQVLSACFVAFAHGSNDVGNAVAPLAAIASIQAHQSLSVDAIAIPLWVLGVGGVGLVVGLALFGQSVIHTIGESITTIQPSQGFCAELATATTVLLASQAGLPVSTSHALVGAVVGVGWIQRQSDQGSPINGQTLGHIALAWIATIPISAVLSASIFALISHG